MRDRLAAASELELLVDVVGVVVDHLVRDLEQPGDLLVRHPGIQKLQDLTLSPGQRVDKRSMGLPSRWRQTSRFWIRVASGRIDDPLLRSHDHQVHGITPGPGDAWMA